MFALMFCFPTGRYHATPWGRHVNEGAVAWPPEPYRILRALIATWHRKADRTRWGEPALHRLIEALAASTPHYRLPRAVHAHTRHYMPQGKLEEGRERTSLVFDAFFRLSPDEELVIAWPDLVLDPEAFALAEHLAPLMGYLGRAESIAIGRATGAIDAELLVVPGTADKAGWTTEDLLAPLTAADYAAARPGLLTQNSDKPKSRARTAFEATVPATLTDALQVETSQLQAAGWSRPPAGQRIRYARPEVGPRPLVYKPRPAPRDDSAHFQIARFVLAGRPLPPITDAIRIGELFRRAMMACVGEPVPAVLSGRDDAGKPLRDPQHAHAFFLPEDDDGDGFIDHLILYVRSGLPPIVRQAAENLRLLWLRDRRSHDSDDDGDASRQEWRTALEGFGEPGQFGGSRLLRSSRIWTSATPYLRPWHIKRGNTVNQTVQMIRTECEHRGWSLQDVHPEGTGPNIGSSIHVGGGARNVLAFHRFRSRRGLVQPDRAGLAVRLLFSDAMPGPVALGFGCHFGLGLFHAEPDQPDSVR